MRYLAVLLFTLVTARIQAQDVMTRQDSVNACIADAKQSLEGKRYLMVIYHCEKGLIIDPQNADLYLLKGDAYYEMDNTDGALACYTRSLLFHPANPSKAYTGKGTCEYDLRQYADAIADLRLGLPGDPKNKTAHNSLILAYMALRQPDSALYQLNISEKIYPNNTRFFRYHGDICEMYGQYDSAVYYYQKSIETAKDKDVIRTYNHCAKVLIKSQLYRQAMEMVQKALAMDGNNYESQKLYAEADLGLENYEEFKTIISQLFQNHPQDPDIFLLLGKANYYTDQYNEALVELDSCQRKSKRPNAEALFTKGQVNYDAKYYYEAEKNFEDAYNADRTYGKAFAYAGDCFFKLHDVSTALNNYNKAIRLAPKDRVVYAHRGEYYLMSNDYDKALADYTIARNLDPTNDLSYVDLCKTYVFMKKEKEAMENANKSMQISVARKDTLSIFSSAFMKTMTFIMFNKLDSALHCMNRLPVKDPSNMDAQCLLKVVLYFSNQKYDKAVQLLNGLDSSYLYKIPDIANFTMMSYGAMKEYNKWVKTCYSVFQYNRFNYEFLNDLILYSPETAKRANMFKHETQAIGNGYILSKYVDSTMNFSIELGEGKDTIAVFNRYSQIIRQIDKDIPKFSSPAVLYLMKARCLGIIHDASAIDSYDKAIATDPEYKAAYYLRGLYRKNVLKDEVGGDEDLRRSQ